MTKVALSLLSWKRPNLVRAMPVQVLMPVLVLVRVPVQVQVVPFLRCLCSHMQ